MFKSFSSAIFLISALLTGSIALADKPSSLTTPDKHSVEVKGKVNLYRVQTQGMEFGPDNDLIDAEILVTVDSLPNKVLTIRLHEDSPPVNMIMANTLRDAYLKQAPVTIYYQFIPTEKKNLKILMVQMN